MAFYLFTILTIGGIGLIASVLLYIVAQKFKVDEDPRIDIVQQALPSANCGGCGFPGCRAFAEAVTQATNLKTLFCPVGGNKVMSQIATVLNLTVEEHLPRVAVVRCNGTCSNRPKTSVYNGPQSCAMQHALYAGQAPCITGCLGCADCVRACMFNAITMNSITHLPMVNDNNCTQCGMCASACPRNIIELRKKAANNRKIYVACVNTQKGAVAKRNCAVACIGCGKCAKVCNYNAITINNNLAFINSDNCKLCRKCVTECPTGAIHEVNFPQRKQYIEIIKEEELTLLAN